MLSIEELRTWLKSEEADDELVYGLLDAAVAHVDNETGMKIGSYGSVVQTITYAGGPLSLLGTPVEGEDITVERWNGSAWETVESTAYYADGSYLWPSGSADWSAYGVTPVRFRVTYTSGHPDGTQPEPIKQAVRMLVQMWFDGDTSEDTLRAVRLLLAPYRRVVV